MFSSFYVMKIYRVDGFRLKSSPITTDDRCLDPLVENVPSVLLTRSCDCIKPFKPSGKLANSFHSSVDKGEVSFYISRDA